ncbi:MAG: hypothetical protein SWC40_08810 [Thermodesulfobacteriota bacterium]|nr:hypothetical protein [Thermodesulfobacteriota bacterium]
MTQKKMDWLLHQLAYHKAGHNKDSAFQVWQEENWSFPGQAVPKPELGNEGKKRKGHLDPAGARRGGTGFSRRR